MNTYKYTDETHTSVSVTGEYNGTVPLGHRFWKEWGIEDAVEAGEVLAHDFKTTEQLISENESAAIQTRFDAVYAPLDTVHGLIDVGRGKDGILGMENIKDAVAAHGSGLTEVESVAWIMSDNSVATLTIADLNQIIVDFNMRKQTIFTAYGEWRAGDKQEAFTL